MADRFDFAASAARREKFSSAITIPGNQFCSTSALQVRRLRKTKPLRIRKVNARATSTTQWVDLGAPTPRREPLSISITKQFNKRRLSFSTQETWELSESQQKQLQELKQVISILEHLHNKIIENEKSKRLTMDHVVTQIGENMGVSQHWVRSVQKAFQGADFKGAVSEMSRLSPHVEPEERFVKEESLKTLLSKLGIVEFGAPQSVVNETTNSMNRDEGSGEDGDEDDTMPSLDSLQSLTANDAVLEALELEKVTNVPKLSFDLSRVLFNPGVYQLQDPRSRVYNFDPYLQKIMPVAEFNFDALNPYITSSEDDTLQKLAAQHDKRYTASSSSMSAALQHFHFLLSSWRTLNVDSLSKGFRPETLNFTRIHRSPSAIFLRWRDGVYAVDADKEFDSANVLMSLGHTMEKLFTLEKEEFEQYRKSSARSQQEHKPKPEQYHYGGLAKFLLRSQLDAHDPRLPGTGMFDLKTRAVVAVRMILSDYEKGLGYQIKDRQGTWESYEREYYDMMRSAFLKYSLQVRMGRMDGIFVAYHNVESIFGFQYISLPELDLALHGQTDSCLGDQEFALSVKLLSDIFDRVTESFPGQSIRFHFETRESAAKVREPVHRMYVFAEAMPEEEIQAIQKSNRQEIETFEHKLRNPEQYPVQHSPEPKPDASEGSDGVVQNAPQTPTGKDNAADVNFLEGLEDLKGFTDLEGSKDLGSSKAEDSTQPENPILGFELVVRSLVNGKPVLRPDQLAATDKWTLKYTLKPMKEGQAEAKYNMCKFRRKNALRDARDGALFNSYFSNLVAMSEQGAKWRRELDELDAQRKRVVLYGDATGDETMKAETAS